MVEAPESASVRVRSVSSSEQTPSPGGPAEPLTTPRRRAFRLKREHVLELVATVVLALATIGTAWSGYQATRWSGEQASDYVRASGLRVESSKAETRAGQNRLFDSQVFSQWLNAYSAGDTKLAGIYLRRFRDEFTVAFDAWMATDPFNNPSAPPGPLFMPQYVSADQQTSDQEEAQAAAMFDQGAAANEYGDEYVLNTVFFASALFLAGIAGRFTWDRARIAVLVVSAIALLVGLISTIALPID
jgi:hypothetical protein